VGSVAEAIISPEFGPKKSCFHRLMGMDKIKGGDFVKAVPVESYTLDNSGEWLEND
jgi:hypothetical protein